MTRPRRPRWGLWIALASAGLLSGCYYPYGYYDAWGYPRPQPYAWGDGAWGYPRPQPYAWGNPYGPEYSYPPTPGPPVSLSPNPSETAPPPGAVPPGAAPPPETAPPPNAPVQRSPLSPEP